MSTGPSIRTGEAPEGEDRSPSSIGQGPGAAKVEATASQSPPGSGPRSDGAAPATGGSPLGLGRRRGRGGGRGHLSGVGQSAEPRGRPGSVGRWRTKVGLRAEVGVDRRRSRALRGRGRSRVLTGRPLKSRRPRAAKSGREALDRVVTYDEAEPGKAERRPRWAGYGAPCSALHSTFPTRTAGQSVKWKVLVISPPEPPGEGAVCRRRSWRSLGGRAGAGGRRCRSG